jgi:hypothetical protein
MTHDDALPSSIPCVFKRSRDLTLCGLLALAAWRQGLAAWRQGKDKLQGLGERIGDYLKRRHAMSHHWPFLSGSISDVTADQLRKRDSDSPGKAAARITTLRSALASRSTTELALSLSLQTCVAVNAKKKSE